MQDLMHVNLKSSHSTGSCEDRKQTVNESSAC